MDHLSFELNFGQLAITILGTFIGAYLGFKSASTIFFRTQKANKELRTSEKIEGIRETYFYLKFMLDQVPIIIESQIGISLAYLESPSFGDFKESAPPPVIYTILGRLCNSSETQKFLHTFIAFELDKQLATKNFTQLFSLLDHKYTVLKKSEEYDADALDVKRQCFRTYITDINVLEEKITTLFLRPDPAIEKRKLKAIENVFNQYLDRKNINDSKGVFELLIQPLLNKLINESDATSTQQLNDLFFACKKAKDSYYNLVNFYNSERSRISAFIEALQSSKETLYKIIAEMGIPTL